MNLWPQGGLWRHADFIRLWSAETVSQFGSQVSLLALPLAAVLVLHASAFQVATLNVVEFLPFVLISLPAGVWVDRLRRRPILVIGDAGRALLLASVPVAYAFGALTIGQLYVVAFLVGTLTVFFDVAYQSYLPSLVERAQIADGNAKLEISRAGAQIGGPGFAGLLVGWLTAPYAILVDAASFVGSALFIFGIHKSEVLPAPADAPRRDMRRELGEGLRYVAGNRYLRAIASCTASFNFFGSIAQAVLIVYAVRVLRLTAPQIGLMFSIANVGALIGALTATRASRAFGVGRTIIGAALVTGPAFLTVPFAPRGVEAVAVIGPAIAISGLTNVIYNVTQISFRQAITPERLQGRMNAVMRFLVWGTIPLGALLGGVLASQLGLRTAIWVGAVGSCLPFLTVLLSPVRSLREAPEPDEPLSPSGAVLAESPTPIAPGA